MRNCCVAILLLLAIIPNSLGKAGTFVVANDAAQLRLMLELRAQQFLNRATFGAKDTEIAALADRMAAVGINAACIEWIDTQFATPATLHVPLIQSWLSQDGFTVTSQTGSISRYRHHAWWHTAITAPDQLKQRLAWALSQIVVVSESINDTNYVPATLAAGETPYFLGLSSYYDMLLNNSDDRYRDVLQGVTYHPMMGLMLSSLRNMKANPATGAFPDENYAREVMQLFSIGLNEMNLDGTFKLDGNGEVIPTYDNETIQAFARVFTGFNYASGSPTNIFSGFRDFNGTMQMTPSQHDFGPKTLLNGVTLPGNTVQTAPTGNADVKAALDNVYAHPNVAPFISKLLIQRFIRSNPSKGYIQRVATVFNDNGGGVKGDLKAVMKAILIDNEAWSSIRMTRLRNPVRLEVTSSGTEFGKLVEPVVQYASFFRRYGVPPASTGGRYFLSATPGTWNQSPFRSASVFNFYLPNHQPTGGLALVSGSRNIPNQELFAPEFQIMTAVVANAWQNRSRSDIINEYIDQFLYTGVPNVRLTFDFATEKTLAATPASLVEHLDKVLCNGIMTTDFRTRLTNAITTVIPQGTTNPNPTRDRDRMRGALITTMNSPYYLIRY